MQYLDRYTPERVQYKKVTQINMAILPQAALKGVTNQPGATPQEKIIYSPRALKGRYIKINIYHALSGLIDYGISKPQGVALGWYI